MNDHDFAQLRLDIHVPAIGSPLKASFLLGFRSVFGYLDLKCLIKVEIKDKQRYVGLEMWIFAELASSATP